MKFSPRPYQEKMFDHILSLDRCALFAGMGTGKTVVTLSLLDYLWRVERRRALVLAPLRVARSTWPDEARKWDQFADLKVSPIIGTAEERLAALRTDAAVYTMNYDNIVWLRETLGDRWPFSVVVADESTRLKGFRITQGTKRAQALAQVAHKRVKRWINLTGTPSPNGLKDLWGQMWFVDGGRRLGNSFDAFARRWFYKTFDGTDIVPHLHSQNDIQQRIQDVCLSIEAKDWFDLREPIITNIEVDLPPAVRPMYVEMQRRMFIEIENEGIEAFNAAAKTQKLLQLANGFIYPNEREDGDDYRVVHDEKLDALESIIEEAAGAPVLVAYNYTADLARLRKRFPQGRVLDKRASTIIEWNAGLIPVLFAHPKSAGHGLNLQDGGNILVFFGLDWNLEEHMQIIERIGPTRQAQAGHDRPMYIYRIMTRATIERSVAQRLDTKRSVQDVLMEAMKGNT